MIAPLSSLLWTKQNFFRQDCEDEESVFTWWKHHREDSVKGVRKGTKTVNIMLNKSDCTTLVELVLQTISCNSLKTLQSLSGQFLPKTQVRFQRLKFSYLSTHNLAWLIW